MLDVGDVRLGIGQVLAEDLEGLDLAFEQAFHHLGDHQAGLVGQAGDAPGLLELGAGFRIGHLLVAGKDIGQCTHVAGALDVVLAAQGIDAAALHAHVAQQHLEVGTGDDVVSSAGVLGDPEGVAAA